MAAGTHGFRGGDRQRFWASVCAALGAHALLAILFVQVAPAAVPREPALQWIELAENVPTLAAHGTRAAPPSATLRVNTTHARRPGARAHRARGHEAAATPKAHEKVAMEKQMASAHDTPASAAGALDDDARQRGVESARAGGGSVAPAGGVSDGTLATRAVLIASSAACTGLFPAMAASDDGVVTLSMEVAPSGRVHAGRVLDERPLGEGFGDAARRCLQRVRFQPALDRLGRHVASTSVLRLRFARHPGDRRPLTAALTR